LSQLLSIKEYPSDMQNVLTLYAEGYSLADFLVQAGGKARYLEFLETAHRHGWDRAIAEHYNLKDVSDLESRWNSWVMAGSPQLKIPKDTQLASNENTTPAETQTASAEFERPVIRGQSPEQAPAASEQRVASAPETKPTVPLPETKTSEVREESPGWRRMREHLKEIPEDFVNPANDPIRRPGSKVTETAEVETMVQTAVANEQSPWTEAPSPPTRAAFNESPPPAPDEPVFRFELD
jgi:hypothetical protein